MRIDGVKRYMMPLKVKQKRKVRELNKFEQVLALILFVFWLVMFVFFVGW